MTEKERYYHARIAIRDGKDAQAYLRLGILYAQGIGTRINHVLANYFFEKAITMGCQEAERYLELEYELGTRNLVEEVDRAALDPDTIAPNKYERLKKQLDKDRSHKHYGNLSMLRDYLHIFYPDYNQDKAIVDILNGRDTVNADLFYALSTSDNHSEIYVDVLDSFLSQLFSPITNDKELYQRIIDSDNVDILTKDEYELLQCLVNITHAYDNVCRQYKIDKKELFTIEEIEKYPYIKVSTLALLRRQAFRCLLSVSHVDSHINEEFLHNLHSDEELLNVCEKIEDKDLQLFLISFVELNIDCDSLERSYQSLKKSFLANDLAPIVSHLNEFTERLSRLGIEHHLPRYTTNNLPLINISRLIIPE